MPHQRKTHLLLIGIDAYQHKEALSYPVSDCEGFFQVSQAHYGFTLVSPPLYNDKADWKGIYGELKRLSDKDEYGDIVSANDDLVIYFSGHGYFDKNLKKGFWVPFEGVKPSDTIQSLFSIDHLKRLLNKVKARHILIIIDACFSQSFTFTNIKIPIEIQHQKHKGLEDKPSRWVMTSGRLETVPDNSVFAEALRHILYENSEESLSVKTLDTLVRQQVKEKIQGKWIPDCQLVVDAALRGGEFFLSPPKPSAQYRPSTPTKCRFRKPFPTNATRLAAIFRTLKIRSL